MGRKKLALRPIENAASRQVTFNKRKDSILKKAHDLAVLCAADVAVIIFSPAGRLASFATDGRIEDILLRFVNKPDQLRGGRTDEANQMLAEKLERLKHEGEMLDKIRKIQELEDKLGKVNHRRGEALEKMRYYEPNVESIHSGLEAEAYQQFLTTALQRIKFAKEKLLGSHLAPVETSGIMDQQHQNQMEKRCRSREEEEEEEDWCRSGAMEDVGNEESRHGSAQPPNPW